VYYFIIKALHLIGMVSWFAGLFYIPRIFIYSIEAMDRPEPDRTVLLKQFEIMGRRLWLGITWPAMIITFVFGLWVAFLYNDWTQPWLLLKLALVAALVVYHLVCGSIRKGIINGTTKWTSHGLRLWNEVATVILIGTIFVACLKASFFTWGMGVGMVVTVFALTGGVYAYRALRKPDPSETPAPSGNVQRSN
jgi:putative membrane protein